VNVLQVNNYHFIHGGAERYYFEVSKFLKEYGNEVLYFSVSDQNNIRSEFSKYFGEAMSFDRSQGVREKISTALRMLYSFENNRRVVRLLSAYRVDIAHAHNIYHRVCPSVLSVIRRKGIPVVMTVHDYKLGCPVYTFYRNDGVCTECLTKGRHRVMVNRCTKGSLLLSAYHMVESVFHGLIDIYNKNTEFFICPSIFLLNKLLEIGLPKEKLIHIPHFIDTRSMVPAYDNSGYVLYAGRLSREKGVITLLRAVKGLGLTLRVAGAGPMRQECEAFAARHGIENVVFEGHREGDDLGALFRGAAFVVFPSEWYENAPMTVLEAFAYGKPVVASKAGGIPEMVEDGMTGLLFSPGDHEELREKIMFLADRPSLVSSMGREARRKVEDNHGSALHYERLMEVYGRACGLRAAETGAAI
jgi:glycosyltransferase involved in cell wall biosynthesis